MIQISYKDHSAKFHTVQEQMLLSKKTMKVHWKKGLIW